MIDKILYPIRRNLFSACFWFAAIACFGTILLNTLARLSGVYLFDDAYMFTRYADNILAFGAIAWNPGGEATYGLTGLLFLSVVAPLRLLLSSPALAVALASMLSGLLFLVLLVLLLERYVVAGRALRRILILFVLLWLAQASKQLAVHFTSGMETMFVLCYATVYIILWKWHERAQSLPDAILVGVWGGLAFFVRPDLLLYSLIVPVSVLLLAPQLRAKRNALLVLGLTVGVVGLQVSIAYGYLNSALPLPFYAKGTAYYGEFIYEQYRDIPFSELVAYGAAYAAFFLAIGAGLLINFRGFMSRRRAIEVGLLVATLIFILYYLLSVLQIMYYAQRFYYPTLPALAFLAVQALASIADKAPGSAAERIGALAREIPQSYWVLATLFFAVSLAPIALTGFVGTRARLQSGIYGAYDVAQIFLTWRQTAWCGLAEFSALPDDLVLATTEVGHPAAMNPQKTIVDLAGLNETDFAHHGFSADLLLAKYDPDLIYMPHPHYKDMIEQISNHPRFVQEYELYPADTLAVTIETGNESRRMPCALGIALHRASPHYDEMKAIIVPYLSE